MERLTWGALDAHLRTGSASEFDRQLRTVNVSATDDVRRADGGGVISDWYLVYEINWSQLCFH